MTATDNGNRFVFRTRGVCPQEIHFRLRGDRLGDVSFVGGGCPGNARLVSVLLEGRRVPEVMPLLEGIACRNGTSCPGQLAEALRAAENGSLAPAGSFCTAVDPQVHTRIALLGDLDGDDALLRALLESVRARKPDAIYCLGNLTGPPPGRASILQAVRDAQILSVQGDRDWQASQASDAGTQPALDPMDRQWLRERPQALAFSLAGRSGFAFYGEYLQGLPGFSDFEPFALEINMVCGLTRFMTDTEVFPALEAMVPQFWADLVLFAQPGRWGHWRVGARDFVGVGAARGLSWGLLEEAGGGVALHIHHLEKESEAPCPDRSSSMCS